MSECVRCENAKCFNWNIDMLQSTRTVIKSCKSYSWCIWNCRRPVYCYGRNLYALTRKIADRGPADHVSKQTLILEWHILRRDDTLFTW